MPPLWKKGKIASVSGFISDFRCRRSGSPLVVQTGFPTSLVDLIVKNRTRLRRSSSKKKKNAADDGVCSQHATLGSNNSSLSSSIALLETPFQSPRSVIRDAPFNDSTQSEGTAELRNTEICKLGPDRFEDDGISTNQYAPVSVKPVFEIGEKLCDSDLSSSSCEELKDDGVSKPRVLCEMGGEFHNSKLCNLSCAEFRDAAVSKRRWPILVALSMVILALVAKEIVVGITASAFVLLFVEFVGRWLGFNLNGGFGVCNRVNELQGCANEIQSNEVGSGRVQLRRSSAFSWGDVNIDEIDNIVSEVPRNNDIEVIESPSDLFNSQRRLECSSWKCEEKDLAAGYDRCLIKTEKVENQRLNTPNFKGKFFKKFMPKKLRGLKNRDVSKEDKLDLCSDELRLGEDEARVGRQEDEHEEICGSESPDRMALVNFEDIDMNRRNTCKDMKRNIICLATFVIVLLGLVGGRAMALILIIVWYLLVKSVGTALTYLKKM